MLDALSSIFVGSDAGSSAAAAQTPFFEEGIGFLKDQLAKTQKRLAPFLKAGKSQVPALTEGTTAEGLDARLARIFNSDIFGSLVDERMRATQGQLAAGGLTRSGFGLQEIAKVPTDLGLAIEQMLTGRSQNLASNAQSGILNLGNLGLSTGGMLADLLTRQGESVASGILADEQSKAAAGKNLLSAASTVGSIFFSDPALKTNVAPVGRIHDLGLYRWDWRPEFDGTVVMECGTVGFMADEVAEKYPHHVGSYGGFMCIDYPALLDELEARG